MNNSVSNQKHNTIQYDQLQTPRVKAIDSIRPGKLGSVVNAYRTYHIRGVCKTMELIQFGGDILFRIFSDTYGYGVHIEYAFGALLSKQYEL